MSSAAEETEGATRYAGATNTDSPPLTAEHTSSDQQWLVKLLLEAGLKGEHDALYALAQRFQQQPHTLRLIAAYLKRWYAGRLNGLETIVGLAHCNNAEALGRVLSAFEHKLHATSDLTLLYLLSLSDCPVPQLSMKTVFRSTLMERWLTRRDDYARFLGPLGRLNTEHWHWVIENLRRLQLLEQAIPEQHDLLFVEAPIREHFRHKLRAYSTTIFEQASQDMDKLFQDTVVEFRQRYRTTPEIRTLISPELKTELALEAQQHSPHDPHKALWKTAELDALQHDLVALRNSLGNLKIRTAHLAEQLRDNNAAHHAQAAHRVSEKNDGKSDEANHLQAQQKSAATALPRLTLPHTARNHPLDTTTAGQDSA